jgi:hypothetical protein
LLLRPVKGHQEGLTERYVSVFCPVCLGITGITEITEIKGQLDVDQCGSIAKELIKAVTYAPEFGAFVVLDAS